MSSEDAEEILHGSTWLYLIILQLCKIEMPYTDYTLMRKTSKRSNLSKNILPNNSKSLWNAVLVSKDHNSNDLPHIMYNDSIVIEQNSLLDMLAQFIKSEIDSLKETA